MDGLQMGHLSKLENLSIHIFIGYLLEAALHTKKDKIEIKDVTL